MKKEFIQNTNYLASEQTQYNIRMYLTYKVILTLYLRSFHFMLGFLLDHQNMESVLCQFHWLENILGIDLFRELCPVILTDNGSEFKDSVSLKESLDVQQRKSRTRIFYCDPGKAYQKGGIEKNHEFIRYALPKGRSLEGYTQEDLTLLMDHINSYSRNQRAFFTPLDLTEKAYPELIQKLGLLSLILYTSDAADEEDSVDLGGRRIIKKKK